MFGNGNKRGDALANGKVNTIIGEGIEIKGEIQSAGVVRIDGSLEGRIQHAGELIIGPKGRLSAAIQSKTLAVAGAVRGEITVEGKLELLPGSRVHADIHCGHLIVHQGAMFHGRSKMGSTVEQPETEPTGSDLTEAE